MSNLVPSHPPDQPPNHRTSQPQTSLRLRTLTTTDERLRRYSAARRGTLPRAERVVAVEGLWAHRTLASLGLRVETFLWCPSATDPPPDVSTCVRAVCELAGESFSISERTLRRIHPGAQAPGLLSLVRLPSAEPVHQVRRGRGSSGLVLVADGIEYAGNLGTLIRTADACGADAVALSATGVRATHPKVFVASRGTVATVPILEFDHPEHTRDWLVARGSRLVVADPSARTHYLDADYSGPTAIVVGAEGPGLHPVWRLPPAEVVSIPMAGQADSLNVAVSAAVLLFAARAARRETPSAARVR